MGKEKRTGKMGKPKARKSRIRRHSGTRRRTDTDSTHSAELRAAVKGAEKDLAGLADEAEGEDTAVDRAQRLMSEAWEATDPSRRIKLAFQALAVSGDCADACVLLAEEAAQTIEEAFGLYRKGVEAGERTLGPEIFEEEVGHFWGLVSTRPYMRACQGLAECLWILGHREEAVRYYQVLLRLNSADNQGIRTLLMPCLIELDRDGEGTRLFEQFQEESTAAWRYSKALLDFRMGGAADKAKLSFQQALELNVHVPACLLDKKKMPEQLPDVMGFCDVNEAVSYAYGNKAAWQATPGALEWFAAEYNNEPLSTR